MPAHNPHKVQLNVFVSREAATSFRVHAKKAGYERQPSPMFERVMAAYNGNLKYVYKALAEAALDPAFAQTPEQQTYITEIIELLQSRKWEESA